MVIGSRRANTLYEVGTWRAQPLALPPDAEVVAWINPHYTIADSITQYAPDCLV